MKLSLSILPLILFFASFTGSPLSATQFEVKPYEPLGVVRASVTNQLSEGQILKLKDGTQLVGADYFTVRIEGADKSAPDVILIPGLSTPSDVWSKTATQLKDRYRVHIIQIRGFGDLAPVNNPLPEGKTHFDDYIHEVADYIDDYVMGEMKGSKPAIIGHSLGGFTAMTVAARAPQVVDKVMLVDSLPFFGLVFDRQMTVDRLKPQAEQMRDSLSMQSSATPDHWVMQGMSATEVGRKQVKTWAVMSDPKITAAFLYDLMTTDIRPLLPEVAVPMTMLYPVDEAVVSELQVTADYKAAFAGAKTIKFEKIDDSRHFIMLDQQEAFAAAVERFLQEDDGNDM